MDMTSPVAIRSRSGKILMQLDRKGLVVSVKSQQSGQMATETHFVPLGDVESITVRSKLDVLTLLLTTGLFITWLGVAYAYLDPGTSRWDFWNEYISASRWIMDFPVPVVEMIWILILPSLIVPVSFAIARSLRPHEILILCPPLALPGWRRDWKGRAVVPLGPGRPFGASPRKFSGFLHDLRREAARANDSSGVGAVIGSRKSVDVKAQNHRARSESREMPRRPETGRIEGSVQSFSNPKSMFRVAVSGSSIDISDGTKTWRISHEDVEAVWLDVRRSSAIAIIFLLLALPFVAMAAITFMTDTFGDGAEVLVFLILIASVLVVISMTGRGGRIVIRTKSGSEGLNGLPKQSVNEYVIPLGSLSSTDRREAEALVRRARAAKSRRHAQGNLVKAGLAQVAKEVQGAGTKLGPGEPSPTRGKTALGTVGRSSQGIVTLERLGQGGMATVFLAKDERLGRMVAVKVLHENRLGDQEAVARFEREARIVAGLDHPNILGLYGIEELDGGRVGLVMPYVQGGTLAQRLKEEDGGLPVEEVIEITRSVLHGLSYAHGRGVVHRDVKPGNVFLDHQANRVLVADFGIATAAGGQTALTQTGSSMGTPNYMAPEQIDSVSDVDGRADIYAVGMMMWEMLTGEQPWAGETLFNVIFKQKMEDLESPVVRRNDIPDGLVSVWRKATRKNREQRWATADEMLRALFYWEGGALAGGGSKGPPYESPNLHETRLSPFRPKSMDGDNARTRKFKT